MHGNTHIHLDDVAGLGNCFELACLVTPKHNIARAHEQIEHLRGRFAPALGEPIATGYAELVAADIERANA
jgi:adenylate cyclase class IV